MPRAMTAFFCDDVRQENNGKFIFIGVYTGVMTVPQLPYLAKLFPVLTLDMRPEEIRNISFKVASRASGAEFNSSSMDIDDLDSSGPQPEMTLLVLPPYIAPMSASDIIDLTVAVNGEEAALAGSIQIIRAPAS